MGIECHFDIDMDVGDDACETLQDVMLTTHASFFCDECKRIVSPGEKYAYYQGKQEGEVFENSTCTDCISIRDTFFTCYCFGSVLEDLENEIGETNGEVPEVCLRELTPLARELVCEMIEDYWERYFDDED